MSTLNHDSGRTTNNSIAISQSPRVNANRERSAIGSATQAPQADAKPRQQDKRRRAQVRGPSRQIQDRRGRIRIGRIHEESARVDEVARVVEQHEHHHRAADEIDGVEPLAG